MKKFKSSVGDVKDFERHIVWIDIRRELIAWKRSFENELKTLADEVAAGNETTASVLVHLGDINGRIKAVDYVLGITDSMISVIESEKDYNEEDGR